MKSGWCLLIHDNVLYLKPVSVTDGPRCSNGLSPSETRCTRIKSNQINQETTDTTFCLIVNIILILLDRNLSSKIYRDKYFSSIATLNFKLIYKNKIREKKLLSCFSISPEKPLFPFPAGFFFELWSNRDGLTTVTCWLSVGRGSQRIRPQNQQTVAR